MDETYLGGLAKFMHYEKRKRVIKGTGHKGKVGVIGVLCLFWGVRMLPKQKVSHEAHRLLGPGLDPEEWVLVGSGGDIVGFLDALQSELSQKTESGQTQ